ncbi:60Kd inner membrane protein-domain-containing protein [Haematococcus lacustris]
MGGRRQLLRACGRLLQRAHPGPQPAAATSFASQSYGDANANGTVGGSLRQHQALAWSPFAASAGAARHLAWWSRAPPAAPPAVPTPLVLDDKFTDPQTSTPSPSPSSPPPLTSDPMPEGGLLFSSETLHTLEEACQAVEVAALDAAKDDSLWTAAAFISGIQAVHEQLGLPWWASVVLVNIVARILAFPVMLASQRATARMATLNLELMPVKKLQEAMVKVSNKEEQMRVHSAWLKETDRVRLQHGAAIPGLMGTMFGTLLINGVVFISIFNGVSNLMVNGAPSLKTGGIAWFTDLTVSDAMYGLPALCTLTTLAMIQWGMNITGDSVTPERAGQAAFVKNLFRGMALLFLPFGAMVPSGVALLWVSNSFFSVVIGTALRNGAIRRACSLPSLQELAAVSERLQAAAAADPMSFVPPPPPAAPTSQAPSEEPAAPSTAAAAAATGTTEPSITVQRLVQQVRAEQGLMGTVGLPPSPGVPGVKS